MATYNITRFTRQVLKRYRRESPSLTLHLYPTHFRFEHQHGNFAYDSPMKCFLEAIREQKLPTDLLDVLDLAQVKYYEGCLIVEVHDHRSAPPPPMLSRPGLALSFASTGANESRSTTASSSRAEVYRIVLGTSQSTLWTELGIMERRKEREREEMAGGMGMKRARGWTEEEAVEMESIILNRTVPPLCLSPSLQTTRIANSLLRATTLRPPKKKRTTLTVEGDEDEVEEVAKREREERERIMRIGDDGVGRSRGHAFARLAFIEQNRIKMQNPASAGAVAGGPPGSVPVPPANAAPAPIPTATAPQPTSSGITSIRLGLPAASASTTASPAGSPPASGAPSKPKKKSLTAAELADPEAAEKKRLLAAKKRQESKARQKEKKEQEKREAALRESAGDLVVGGGNEGGVATPQAKFTWASGGVQ